MSRLLELIAGIFTRPRATLNDLAAKRPLGAAAAVFLLGVLLSSLSGLGALQQELPGPAGLLLAPMLLFTLFFGLGAWVLHTSILHFFAEVVGGRGAALDLFACLPFAALPGAVLTALGSGVAALTSPWASVPFSLGAFVWGLILQVLALAAAYGLSIPRALGALLLPVAILLVAGLTLVLVGALTMLPYLFQVIEEMPAF